ncbi:hypothetical protein [Lysobacter gummosus]|uniref:hypothetical protein n=1 Tax=Lysobacter gummosus TaxID=262324 RepID=UPI00363513E2
MLAGECDRRKAFLQHGGARCSETAERSETAQRDRRTAATGGPQRGWAQRGGARPGFAG